MNAWINELTWQSAKETINHGPAALRKRRCPVALLVLGWEAAGGTGAAPGPDWRRLPPPGPKTMAEKRQLFVEMRAQNLDVIRLSAYRTTCRFNSLYKKRCNLHLVDTWNMIDSFEAMVWIYWTIPLRSGWPTSKRSSHPSTRRWTRACLLLTILILKNH